MAGFNTLTLDNGLIRDGSTTDNHTTFGTDITADMDNAGSVNGYNSDDHVIMHLRAPQITGTTSVVLNNANIVIQNVRPFGTAFTGAGSITVRDGSFLLGTTSTSAGSYVINTTGGTMSFPGSTIGLVNDPAESAASPSAGPHFVYNENGSDQDNNDLAGTVGRGVTWNLGLQVAKPGVDFGGGSSRGYILGMVGDVGTTGFNNHWCPFWDCDFSQFNNTDANNSLQLRSGEAELWLVVSDLNKIPTNGIGLTSSGDGNLYRIKTLTPFQITQIEADEGTLPTDVEFGLRDTGGATLTAYIKPASNAAPDDTVYPTTQDLSASRTTQRGFPATGILIERNNYEQTTGTYTRDTNGFVQSGGSSVVIARPDNSTLRIMFYSMDHYTASELEVTPSALNADVGGSFDTTTEVIWLVDNLYKSTVTTTTACATLQDVYTACKLLLMEEQLPTEFLDLTNGNGGVVLELGSTDINLSTTATSSSYSSTTGFTIRCSSSLGTDDLTTISTTGTLDAGDVTFDGVILDVANLENTAAENTTNFTIGVAGGTHAVDLSDHTTNGIEWDVNFAGTVTLNAGAGNNVNFTRNGGTGTFTSGTGTITEVESATFESPSSGTLNVWSVSGTTFTHRGTLTSASSNLVRSINSGTEDSWIAVYGGPGFNTQVYRTGTLTATTTISAPTASPDALSNDDTSGDNVYTGGSAVIQGTPTSGNGNTTIRIDGTDRGTGGTNPIPNGIQTNNLLSTLLDDQNYQLAIAVNNNSLTVGSWSTGITNIITFVADNTTEISELAELESDGNTVERLTGLTGDYSVSGGTATLSGNSLTIDLVDVRENTTPDSNVIGNVVADRITGDIDNAVTAAEAARDAAQATESTLDLNTF